MSYSQSKRKLSLGLLAFSGCLLWNTWVQAGTLQVNPLRLTLSPTQPTDVITIRNDSPQPTVVQVQAFTWAQEAEGDSYRPSTDLLATPPIFALPAGGSQIVRVGLRRMAPQSSELSYR